MTLQEMISGSLKTDDIVLTEEELMESFGFSVSPLVAFLTFKKKALNVLSKPLKIIAKPGKKVAAKGLITAEKLKAEVEAKGHKPNDTVYHYTSEQKEFLTEIYSKYGKKILREIEKFRKNILAPYQVIKRLVKENRSLTNKEINGMTYEDYLRYRESGRKKIEGKQKTYSKFQEKDKQLNMARDGYNAALENLKNFKDGKDPTTVLTDKVLKLLGYGEEEYGGYSASSFKETEKNILRLEELIKKSDGTDVYNDDGTHIGSVTEIRNRINKFKKQGSLSKKEKPKKDEKTSESKNVSFERAFLAWQQRREFRENFKTSVGRKAYENYYLKVLQDTAKEAQIKKDELFKEFMGVRGSTELNSFEKKIWGQKLTRVNKKAGSLDEPNEIDNWYLKLNDEDFEGKEKKFAIPESVRKAEDAVNKETKRLERRLKEIMSEDEVKELKRLRLINNLITVREMKDPDALFKKSSSSEDIPETRIEDEPEEDESSTTSEEFKTKLNEFINSKYDSIMELNSAKENLRGLIKKTDDKITKKYNKEIDNFLNRMNIKPKTSEKQVETSLLDINDIQNKINELLGKKYNSADEIREEQIKLNNLINRYKQQDPENAERELKETQVLLDRLNRYWMEQGQVVANVSK